LRDYVITYSQIMPAPSARRAAIRGLEARHVVDLIWILLLALFHLIR